MEENKDNCLPDDKSTRKCDARPHITKERILNWARSLSNMERASLTREEIRTVFKCSREQADNALHRWIPIIDELKQAEIQSEAIHHSRTPDKHRNLNASKSHADYVTYMSTDLHPTMTSAPLFLIGETYERAARQVIRRGLPIRLDTFMSLLCDAEKVQVTPHMLSDLFDVSLGVAERLYHKEVLPFIREVHLKSVDPITMTPNKGLSLLTDDLSSDVVNQDESTDSSCEQLIASTKDHKIIASNVDGDHLDHLRRSAALSLLINNADGTTLRQVVKGLILNGT